MQCNCQYSNLCYNLIIMSKNRYETWGSSSGEAESSLPVYEDESGILENHELGYSSPEGVYEEETKPFVVGPGGRRECSVDELIVRLKREQGDQ